MGSSAGTGIQAAGMVIGGVVGFAFGAPMIGIAIGGLAGGLVSSFVLNRSTKLEVSDISLMNGNYGHPIPRVYGTVRLGGTMIWQTDIETKGHGLGKGTGSSTYSYWQSAALVFCNGPADILKIYLDGKLFYDSEEGYERSNNKFAMRWHNGSEDQVADTLIEEWVASNIDPASACPAYRGLAYLVLQKVDLVNYGNRFPQVSAVVSTNATRTTRFVPLTTFSPDVSSGAVVMNGATAVAVDWSRETIYTLGADKTIRAFDWVSGKCFAARTINELLPGSSGGDQPANIFCCEGGGLYVTNADFFAPHTITRINPDTLTAIATATMADNPGILWYGSIRPFQLQTSTGLVDMFAFIDGNVNRVGICNPLTGKQVSFEPAHWGIWACSSIVIGNQDTDGTDVWLLNSGGVADSSGTIELYKVRVHNSDPSLILSTEWKHIRQFTSADMGFASPIYTLTIASHYYFADDSLIFSVNQSSQRTIKWSEAKGIDWTVPGAVADSPYDVLDRGFAGANLINVDASTGGFTTSPSTISTNGVYAFDSYRNAVLTTVGGVLNVAYMMRTTNSEYAVADIIAAECALVGLDETLIDVSGVTATTYGYTVTESKSAAAVISDLCQVYQIDVVESDYVLRFIQRGQASVATITQDDLLSMSEEDPSQFWRPTVAQQQEMPLQINLRFNDPGVSFQAASTYARRNALDGVQTVYSKRIKSLDLPVVATATEARAIAETWLYTMWAERTTYEFALSPKHLRLDPGDNITVNLDNGDSYAVRLAQSEIGANMAIRLKGSSEDGTVYTSAGTPGAEYGALPPTITQSPFGELLQFNVPLLRDSDDTGGVSTRIYWAVGGYHAGWRSGALYRSTDNATWENFATAPSAVTWGHSVDALGDTASKFATDYTNTVRVALVDDGRITLPASISYTELMNGQNAALLGQEVICFQTVTANEDGTFTLSGIVRGCRGTEWATGTHAAGDLFILLEEDGTVRGNTLTLAEISTSEQWRLVPSGRFIDQTQAASFTYLGYDLKPYAPVNFQREASGRDLLLSWTRRTRIGGAQQDGTDTAPLGETSEAYEVYLLADAEAIDDFDPTDSLTYVRKISGLTTSQATYTAAQMSADSFVPATDTLYMVVYQLSGAIGRGFRGYEVLPAF